MSRLSFLTCHELVGEGSEQEKCEDAEHEPGPGEQDRFLPALQR